MNDPFRNYDAWLTTDRTAEALERASDLLDNLWAEACDTHNLPVEAAFDEEHAERPIYDAWLAFITLVDQREQRLEAEAYAEYYEEQQYYEDAMAEQRLAQTRQDEQEYLDMLDSERRYDV